MSPRSFLTIDSGWPGYVHRNFYEALLATLRLEGCKFLVVRGNEHNKRYGQVCQRIKKMRDEGVLGADSLPLVYPSSMGHYKDADAMAFTGQGFTRWHQPFDGVTEICLGESEAQRLLRDIWEIPEPEQELLRQLALVYMEDPERSF
jgi:hypothetical protein